MSKVNLGKKLCSNCRHFFAPEEFRVLHKRGKFCVKCYSLREPLALDVFEARLKELV